MVDSRDTRHICGGYGNEQVFIGDLRPLLVINKLRECASQGLLMLIFFFILLIKMLSTCIVGSHDLWYVKLGHVHYSYKKKNSKH